MANRRRRLESQGKKATKQESWQNEWHDTEYQGEMANVPPCPERTLKTPMPQQSSPSSRDEESQWVAVEDRRRRRVAFEETAWDILKYLENSEDLKVSVTELQERLGMSGEAGISIKQDTKQARNENGQFFLIFRQGKEEVCIASWAEWNTQLKGLAELEKRCQNMRQEVNYLSETQMFIGVLEDKIRKQSRATENIMIKSLWRWSWKKINHKLLCYLWRKSST